MTLFLSTILFNFIKDSITTSHMRFILPLLLIAFCPVHAQNINISWSTDFNKESEIKKIIGHQGESVFVLTQLNGKLYTEAYRLDDLSLIHSTPTTMPDFRGNKIEILDIILTGDELISIGYFFNRQENELMFLGFAQKDSTYHILMRIPQKQNNFFRYLVKQSDDKEKFSLAVLVNEKQSGENLSTVSVFNTFFVKQSETTISTEINSLTNAKNGTFNYKINLRLNNDGSYATFVETDNLLYGNLPEKTVKVKMFDTVGSLITQKEINLQKVKISPPFIQFDDNNGLVHFYMFYSNRDDHRFTHLIHLANQQYSLESVIRDTLLLPAGTYVDSTGISPHFMINHCYQEKNGNIILIAEERQYTIYTDSDDNFIEQWTFGDIFALSVDNKQNFTWIQNITKNQETERLSTGISQYRIAENFNANNTVNKPVSFYKWSYLPIYNGQTIEVLFNSKDKTPESEKTIKNLKNAASYSASINAQTGIINIRELDGESNGYLIAPQVFYKISDSQFIIWASDKKEVSLGVINMNQ